MVGKADHCSRVKEGLHFWLYHGISDYFSISGYSPHSHDALLFLLQFDWSTDCGNLIAPYLKKVKHKLWIFINVNYVLIIFEGYFMLPKRIWITQQFVDYFHYHWLRQKFQVRVKKTIDRKHMAINTCWVGCIFNFPFRTY